MINSFTGDYDFLSNYYNCYPPIEWEGISYPTVEHAYQAAKTTDMILRRSIASFDTPGKAKRAGKSLLIRPNWDHIRISIMTDLLILKFKKIGLKLQLINTSPHELVEGNYWHDNFWGSCTCSACSRVIKHNELGKILMMIRDSTIFSK